MTNLFVMPGLGTWSTGQRALGALQALLSIAGVFLMTLWLVWFMYQWIQNEQMPKSDGPYAWIAVVGVVLFAGAWLWALITGVATIRRTREAPISGTPPPKLN